MSLAVQGRSWWERQWRLHHRSIPESVLEFFRGPVGVLRIDDAGMVTSSIKWWRPIHVIVSSQLVLQRRVLLPRSSRNDLRHVVDLFIRQETPFEPTEVLVEAAEQIAVQGDENVAYQVTLLPRAVLDQALKRLRISANRIAKVSLDRGDAKKVETYFALSMFPRRRVTGWFTAVPIVVVLAVTILSASRDLSARQSEMAMLQTQIQTESETAKSLAAELEVRRQASSGRSAALALVSSTPSAFATLEAVRQALPVETEVTRIDLHGGEGRLAVRSANVLKDMQLLATSPMHWASSVEGAITADPRGGGEIATILLRTVEAAKS